MQPMQPQKEFTEDEGQYPLWVDTHCRGLGNVLTSIVFSSGQVYSKTAIVEVVAAFT